MLSQTQLLGVFLVLSIGSNCSVLRYSNTAVNQGQSTGLSSQTSQNASSDNETTVLPGETMLDGDWLEKAEMGNFSLQPLSTLSLNMTAAGLPTYRCDGRAFGRNLNLRSCVNAMDLISNSHIPRTYGERGEGIHDVSLPFRILSSDGLCAIDISHKRDFDFDTMIPDDMKLSVRALIDICVRGNPNQGGVVTNLGENGALAVRVTPYRPNVQCGHPGTAPPFNTCRAVLDLMPTSGLQQRFGPSSDPTAQVVVPKYYTEEHHRCGFAVHTIGSTDVADWYKLWAAAVAVEVMCLETKNAGGLGLGLGKDKQLFVTLEDINPQTPAVGLTSANMSTIAASFS